MNDPLRKAAEMALDALNEVTGWQWSGPMRVMDEVEDVIQALRTALAQGVVQEIKPYDDGLKPNYYTEPEKWVKHEPVVFYRCNGCGHAYEQVAPSSCDCMEGTGFLRVNYYTAPPKREWVGLTDEEINKLAEQVGMFIDKYGLAFDAKNELEDGVDAFGFAEAIEAKLKEKNT